MDRGEALDTLGLPSTAPAAQITEAYRDLAKVWHPDRFSGDPRLCAKAEEKLKRINIAYRTLQGGFAPGSAESTKRSRRRYYGGRPRRAQNAPADQAWRSVWIGAGLAVLVGGMLILLGG